MKKVPKIIISLIAIGVFLYGLWFLAGYTFDWVAGLEKEVTAATITAIIGLFGLLYIQWNSKAKEIADSHRPAKIEVYETFFDIVEHFMAAEKNKVEKSGPESEELPQELKDQFTKLSRGMIVWASPQVIKAWSKFREQANVPKNPTNILLSVDAVLQAIRADLGNSNFGLRRGDLIKLYLSNPSEVDF